MANEKWLKMFLEANVFHKAMAASDHCLLNLSLRKRVQRRGSRKWFMFEAMWTRDEGCREVIETAWDPLNANLDVQVRDRIKSCQAHLQNWNRRVFGNVNKNLKQKQSHLQHLEALNLLHESAKEIQALKKEINEIMIREEMMWNQRTRALWVKCGDRNTKFFHAMASNRRWKNRIDGLYDQGGRWCEDSEEVEGIILDYFKEIYNTSFLVNFRASLGVVDRKVSDAMNEDLLSDFRVEEVQQTLKQMHPTKSPGPDGMSSIFFQRHWDIVGPHVVDCVPNIFRTGVIPNGLNDTYICLNPKVNCPQKMTEFRPISLCNVKYKLVSKVLANRLKSVLPDVISNAQSAFVPGRQITNNVLVAFEVMHCINQRRKWKMGLMAIKLDMSKAYDQVE